MKVVVLCGSTVAHKITDEVEVYDRNLLVLHGPHPSQRGLMSRPGGMTREQRIAWLRKVIEQARDHVEREETV